MHQNKAAGTSTAQIEVTPITVGQITSPLPRMMPLSTALFAEDCVAHRVIMSSFVRDLQRVLAGDETHRSLNHQRTRSRSERGRR